MDRVLVVNVATALFLSLVSLGRFAFALYPHPIVVPDDHRSATSTGEGSFKYNISIRLPDVISVTEYYVRIHPFYPAPGVTFDAERNMTFDGVVVMSIIIKKATSEFTLNALNLNVTSLEIKNLLQWPIAIKETKIDNKIHHFTIVLREPQPVGTVLTLSMKYTGLINSYFDGGLYYTHYMDLKGELHWMVATQLAAFAARAVFPCMDEPAYKAVFHIELIYPSSHVALANTKETTPVNLGNGWSRVTFPPTPVMSTYLIAFTTGPYVSSHVVNKDGTLVRAWGWKGQEEFLHFTAEAAGECLYQMGLYTGIKYPMEKCDHLANPQFPAGAMENFGLVIYKYQFVALDSRTATTLDKAEASRVICHEVSHQWFGDLVSPKYWDDLFLNEGFATHFMRVLQVKAFPTQASFVEGEVIKADRERALNQDASSATHPLITMDGPFFDRITYQKGAMLLRMLSDVMGATPFRDGLQQYLNTYNYSTATHLDLFSILNDAVNRASVTGWSGPLNVTHLMEPYFHQSGFPLIHSHGDKNGLSFSQQPFNDTSAETTSWNHKWIIPIRTRHFDSPNTELQWMVPKELEGLIGEQNYPSKAVNKWHIASYSSATYGRISYDDESLNSLLEKIVDEDVPLGVKISLIGDEVALIARHESRNEKFSHDRLLNILVSVFNTPSTDDPSYSLADIVLPQFEFFASLLRDSIDAPLINRLFEKAFAKVYRSELWEASASWNANAFKYIFLPYAVKHNISDAPAMATNVFHQIATNCKLVHSKNGTSWCSGVPNDIHRAAYCGAARYDSDDGANFAALMKFYSEEVQVNPYFYQEYRALLEGMACTEITRNLKEIIALFVESPLQPPMMFGWLKTNSKASDVLYDYIKNNPNTVLRSRGLSSYLDAMTYNWRSKRRLQQFSELQKLLRPRMDEKQKAAFREYEERIQKNIAWSAKYHASIMRWMYDNLVVVGKERWNERLPGTIIPKKYDVEITPYIPGSGKYEFSRNMTFDGNVKMAFTVTEETSELVVNAHRLVIDVDSILLTDSRNRHHGVSVTEITKDYENGILTIPVVGTLYPGVEYSLSMSYSGFIFDKPHHGVMSNYNFYEFNGKQGWIFSTDFEGGPGSRSLMVCCDEPSYKAKFHITVKHAADMTALSNMINTGTVVSKNGWAVTSFQETPEMSSYLVAICVGHFASLSTVSQTGVLVRAYSWTGMERYADYSLKVMAGSIDYMSEYFNYSFPLSKLDMVALPQHSNRSAMENWGLILGNYERLMVDRDYADIRTLGDVAVTLAHEVVHQWFGNLVTLDWWSNMFLNEGLAEYWCLNAASYALPEQRDYFLDYFRFETRANALLDDCEDEASLPLITDEGELFTPRVYFKGSALFNVLSKTISAETLQKGLRSYIVKNAYANANPEELWSALTEVCAKDDVKGWDGKPLDVAAFMKSWTTEKSFPIVKVGVDHDAQVFYRQESCLTGNATWIIPIISVNKTNEEFNWFYGRDGTSSAWSLPFPVNRLDNVRGSAFIRMYYDRMVLPLMKRNIHLVEDAATHGTILSDAWFFVSKENYTWTQFLDIVDSVDWRDDLIPWSIGMQFMEKMYQSFRFNENFERISKYLISLLEWTYKVVGHSDKPSTQWDKRMLGSLVNLWMCRLDNPHCLSTAKAQFAQLVSQCANSHSGTAHCVGVIPDFRRSMYCYGLKQNPEAVDVVYSLYKYFTDEAMYFNRDGDNLLHALSCLNDTEKLNEYIHASLADELPMKMLAYIGDNDPTAHVLYDYLRKNIQEVLHSDVDFVYFVEAMTTDWSSKEQLNQLIAFKITDDYGLLNEEQRAVWETAIESVIEKQSWLDSNGKDILKWLDYHFVLSDERRERE